MRYHPLVMKAIDESNRKAIEGLNAFQKSAFIAFLRLGDHIRFALGDAFESVFGRANSLLEKFTLDFLDALSSILIQLGVQAGLTAAGVPLPAGGILGAAAPGFDSGIIESSQGRTTLANTLEDMRRKGTL